VVKQCGMEVCRRGGKAVNGLEWRGSDVVDLCHVRMGPTGKTAHIGPPPPPLKIERSGGSGISCQP
jgi:hypothetical protein